MIDHRQTELFTFWGSLMLAHISFGIILLGAQIIGDILLGFWMVIALTSGYKLTHWYGGF